MVIDHTGALIFPNLFILRIIGRLAFPIFAFLISEGFRHTHSVKKYLIRLGVCAVLFQIPDWFSTLYSKLNNVPGFGVHYVLNIFATLFFGLSAIALFDKYKDKSQFISWLSVFAAAVAAEVTGADYGAYGVFYIFLFYFACGNIQKIIAGGILLHFTYAVCEIGVSLLKEGQVAFPHAVQLYSLLAVLPISLYNHQQGKKMKYFFYAFYPLHQIILYLIYWLVTGGRSS